MMKNYLSPITLILLVFGIMFKAMHWPGANVMVIISSLLLLLSSFIAYQENNEAELPKMINHVVFLTLVFLILGSLFRFMHWPGKNVMGTIAYAFMILSCVMMAFYKGHFSMGKRYLAVFTFLLLFVLFNFPKNPVALISGYDYTTSQQINHDGVSQDSTLHRKVLP